jgi:hypothetical protein
VNDVVESQLLLALERLHANLKTMKKKPDKSLSNKFSLIETNIASMRTIWNVRQLVSCEVILALESSVTNVTDKTSLNSVLDNVLLDEITLWQSHLTFGTAVKNGPVKCCLFPNLTRL